MLESREALHAHSRRVAELADLIAAELDLAPQQRLNLKIAALYHDIGELGIPRSVLDKPGPLDVEERGIVETHPVVGETIVRRAIQVREILHAILYHHERWDGHGYPTGLAAREIPLAARLLTVAETSTRWSPIAPTGARCRWTRATGCSASAPGAGSIRRWSIASSTPTRELVGGSWLDWPACASSFPSRLSGSP